ncbi:MAG: glycosyltransferase [Colwellia sp.]
MKKLRTEKEIIATWERGGEPIVSVCCIAFNHENYIRESIEGILMQETSFPFEVIIHDDASTDGTTDIIREYAGKYPKIIKTILQNNNQYSQGKRPSFIAINEALGQYFCICEGDDFWTSEHKLQIQVGLLESKPNVSLCFHPAKIIDGEGRDVPGDYGYYGDNERIQLCRDIIIKGGGYMPMASIMMRKQTLEELKANAPSFLVHNMTHFFYQIFGSLSGGALYYPKTMSAYRSMHEGSWSLKVQSDPAFFMEAAEKYIDSIRSANMITGLVYNKEFSQRIKRRILVTLNDVTIPVEVRKDFFNKYSDSLGIGGHVLWNFVFCCKPLHLLILKIKNKCSR